MEHDFVAKVSVTANAPLAQVWDALVNPEVIKRYMFGATVVSEWKKGSPIVWKGEWKGKPYEDKGVILEIMPRRLLRYSHFSPLSGAKDVPENYHTVQVQLSEEGGRVRIDLSQDKNRADEARIHSEKNWSMMLDGLKRAIES